MKAAQKISASPSRSKNPPPAAIFAAEPVALPSRRHCACGGGCPRCRGSMKNSMTAPSIVSDVLRTSGAPLPSSVRMDMQTRFGEDLSDVRVHTDSHAARSAQAVSAHAYTVGSHIAFGTGRYAPHTVTGRRTLAHELTHVLQQRGAATTSALSVGPAGDAAEQEADSISARVTAGGAGPVSVRAQSGVQMLRRQVYGADGAIGAGTMTPVPGVHGVTFSAQSCGGVRGCVVDFTFDQAYVGRFTTGAGGRSFNAVRVRIRANHSAGCGSCDTLEIVQVMRDITHDASGRAVSAEPVEAPLPAGTVMTPELERMYRSRHLRSGWDDPDAASRGWRVDAVTPRDAAPGYDPTDPFYTHTRAGRAGVGGSDAVIQDTPQIFDSERNVGKAFQTCLVCVSGGVRSALGCITWGMYVDTSGNVSMQPLPVAQCGESTELRDAARRWDSIDGNQDVDLRWRVPG
jgi:hypothetical protein